MRTCTSASLSAQPACNCDLESSYKEGRVLGTWAHNRARVHGSRCKPGAGRWERGAGLKRLAQTMSKDGAIEPSTKQCRNGKGMGRRTWGEYKKAVKTPVQGSMGMYHSWASFVDGRVHEAAAGPEEQGGVIAREPALWQTSAAASAAAAASWSSAMRAVTLSCPVQPAAPCRRRVYCCCFRRRTDRLSGSGHIVLVRLAVALLRLPGPLQRNLFDLRHGVKGRACDHQPAGETSEGMHA